MTTLVPTTALVIADVEILQDTQGRYNLNVLHHASGTGAHRIPSQWMRRDETKELIAELNANGSFLHVDVVKGGNASGVYAHELLAVSYAGWISPTFQLKVNQAFLDRNSRVPTLHDPVLDVVMQITMALDKTRYELAQTNSLVATHETKLNLLLASQERLTIREYVWMNALQPQMPGSLCKAFRKHLNRYCFDNNIPVRTIRTGAQQRQLSNVYPAQAIAATLPGWLIRRNGQLALSPR